MKEYLNLFIDEEYPSFIDKYLNSKTLNRIKHVTQFCGCDYTKLYNPRFLYTRYDHSLVVAHMTWHFTHDKAATIAALLHDVGTPCFAHCIDYVLGDYLNQESSELNILELIENDWELLSYLRVDGISLSELSDLGKYTILENKSPKLCTDRLDGVLHTCYVWLCTNSLEEIKEIYKNIIVLLDEDGNQEIGFNDLSVGEKFAKMVLTYAEELLGNTDKYVMSYISEMVKLAISKGLISFSDLYTKDEEEIVGLFNSNFPSWDIFKQSTSIIKTESKPSNFYVSLNVKKRNVIFLISGDNFNKRITDVSETFKDKYLALDEFKDSTYAYIDAIVNVDG